VRRDRVAHGYERGQVIFYEGNPAFAVYCLHSGKVRLYKEGKHDEEVVLGTRMAGDLIGYREILADEPYASTAEALEKSVACAVPRETIFSLLRENGCFALRLLSQLACKHHVLQRLFPQINRVARLEGVNASRETQVISFKKS
jgi:CRP/FNR family transcriptional regulator